MRLFALASVVFVLVGMSTSEAHASYTTSGSATAYHTCDGSTSLQANGTRAHFGEVASNSVRLGTWIQMVHPKRIAGRRLFRVEDTGGPGFLIDVYAPSCGWMSWWGRRQVTIRVLQARDLWHGLPKSGWRWKCCRPRPFYDASY